MVVYAIQSLWYDLRLSNYFASIFGIGIVWQGVSIITNDRYDLSCLHLELFPIHLGRRKLHMQIKLTKIE